MSDSRTVRLRASLADEQGQGLVEYAFILMLVALAAVGSVALIGAPLSHLIEMAGNAFP